MLLIFEIRPDVFNKVGFVDQKTVKKQALLCFLENNVDTFLMLLIQEAFFVLSLLHKS